MSNKCLTSKKYFNYVLIHEFIYLFIPNFIHSFIHSFISNSFIKVICQFIYPQVHSFTNFWSILGTIQIIRDTFWHFLGLPPPPHVTFLSTFTREITNKNCCVSFLLNPSPLKCHVLFEWPLRAF